MSLFKKCSVCEVPFEVNSINFHKDKSTLSGFYSACKKCNCARAAKRRQKKNNTQTNIQLNSKKKIKYNDFISSQIAALFIQNPSANQLEQLGNLLLEISQKMKNNDRTIINNPAGN